MRLGRLHCPRFIARASALVAFTVSILASAASAADEVRQPPGPDERPGERNHDWVQLYSGEWLKGEITRIYDEKLEFDSDEFDDVVLDWSDVESLIPRDEVTIRLEGRRVLTGSFVMRAHQITFESGGQTLELEREEIIGLIPGVPSEANYWSGSANVGLSLRKGNTDQTDLTLRGEIERHTALTRFRTSYTGEISSSDGKKTADSHRVPSSFDLFLTRRLFLVVPSFEFFSDKFQNIEKRFSTGLGFGYEIYDRGMVQWEVSTSAIHVYTEYRGVDDGDDSENDAAAQFGTRLELDLPRGVEWDSEYRLQIVTTDMDKTNHHAESTIEYDIWGPIELDLTFLFDRVENPKAFGNGARPKSNDYRLTAGLGLDF